MAYVKLPDEIRRIRIPRPDGPAATLMFSVFAGEVSLATGPAGLDRRGSNMRADPGSRLDDFDDPEAGEGAHRIWLRSSRSEQGFEFQDLPISFDPGDVAGVAAVMPPNRRDGPIVAAANVDRNEKVDFVGREDHLLRLLGGYRRDYRTLSAWTAAWTGALARGVAIGVIGYAALRALAPIEAEFGLASPEIVAGALTLVAITHGLVKASLCVLRRARFQRRLLAAVWSGAADALSFVHDHADKFRQNGAAFSADDDAVDDWSPGADRFEDHRRSVHGARRGGDAGFGATGARATRPPTRNGWSGGARDEADHEPYDRHIEDRHAEDRHAEDRHAEEARRPAAGRAAQLPSFLSPRS